jgi:hypothetical protein
MAAGFAPLDAGFGSAGERSRPAGPLVKKPCASRFTHKSRGDPHIPAELDAARRAAEADGRTAVVAAWDGEVRGVLVVADTVKPTSAGAVASCKALGVRRVLLTGDNPTTARGRRGGRHRRRDYRGPAVRQGRRHQAPPGRGSGRGDGRRRRQRRPALAQADLALAIGAGTDVAIEASDLTVVSGDLRAAADAIRLSRTTLRTIKQNSPGRSATSSPHCRWPPPACSTQSSPARRWRSPARQSSPTHCACGASAPRTAQRPRQALRLRPTARASARPQRRPSACPRRQARDDAPVARPRH